MKNKEGRDYIEMSETIASVQDDVISISDTGATLSLSLADWRELVTFVDKKLKGTV
jgi:hypothetical protein